MRIRVIRGLDRTSEFNPIKKGRPPPPLGRTPYFSVFVLHFSVFVCCHSMVVSISVAGSFSDRCETRTAHQRSVVFIRIASNHKVGFIIKSAIALAAEPESVLIPFRSKRGNLLTVRGLVTPNGHKLSSQGPVVRSSSSLVHRSSHCLWWALHPPNIRKSISIFSHPRIHSSNHKKYGHVACHKLEEDIVRESNRI